MDEVRPSVRPSVTVTYVTDSHAVTEFS